MNPSGPDPGPDVDGPDHISAEEAQALAVPDSGLTIVTSRTLEAGGRSFKVHVHEYSGRCVGGRPVVSPKTPHQLPHHIAWQNVYPVPHIPAHCT